MSNDSPGKLGWVMEESPPAGGGAKRRSKFFYADEIEVTASGALVGWRNATDRTPRYIVVSWAPGKWASCHAASCLDGSFVAFD